MPETRSREQVQDILRERGEVEVGCDFCGRPYRFDAVDAMALFSPGREGDAAGGALH
jgi:molecular chaperone Hsp33